jgi:hypothetical protein
MKLKNILLLGSLLILAACESSRTLSDGKSHECVGAFEDEAREPTIRYKASTQNILVAVVFSEMLVPPAVVILSETYCPVSIAPRDSTKK